MRRTLPAFRTGLSVAAAVVLLSACGGSDEGGSASSTTEAESSASESAAGASGSEFCTEAAAVQERVGASFDEQDPASLGVALQEGAAEIRGIEPPAEIAADWNALADGLDQIAAAFAEVDLTDPAAQQALGAKIAELQGPLDTAGTNVETYLRDECGLELDSGESAAPSS
jgi:hypothetical protein